MPVDRIESSAGPGGQLINQRFLPRITEGEIRVLMIFDRPVNLVHKKPGKKGLSATLFSGAKCAPLPCSCRDNDWLRRMPLHVTIDLRSPI